MYVNRLPKNLPYDADTLRARFNAVGIDAEIIEDGETVVLKFDKATFLDHRDDAHKTMIRAGYRFGDGEFARMGEDAVRIVFVPDYENKTGFHD